MNVARPLRLATMLLLFAAPLCADETPAMEALYRGVDTLQKRDWKGAEKQFREAVDLKPDYADAYNKLGQCLFNQGQSMAAVEEFRRATTIDPRLTEAWYGMGFAYENLSSDVRLKDDEKTRKKLQKTQAKDAIAAYEKAVAISPSNDVNALGNSHFRLGVLLRDQALHDATDTAQANLKESIGHSEEAVKLITDFPEAYNELGRSYDMIGRYPEAIEVYTKAIEGNSYYAEAFSNRGVAWWKAGNWDKALEDCRKAIELDPKFAGGHYNFAEVVFARVQELRSKGLEGDRSLIHVEAQKAVDEYRVATELNPDFFEAWYGLAKAYQGYFDYKNAAKTYQAILDKDSKQKKAKALLKALQKEEAGYESHMPKEYRSDVKK